MEFAGNERNHFNPAFNPVAARSSRAGSPAFPPITSPAKPMKICWRIFLSAASLLSLTAGAAEISGKWRAEFDTQIGLQKYVFTFQSDGPKLSGKVVGEIGDQKHEVEIHDGKVEGESVTFSEAFKFQENEIRIDYTGKLSGNEIKFTRKVGDFATEELVAKRVETPPGSSAPAASANAPARSQPNRFGGPIELGSDDKSAFSDAPNGFDIARETIPHGKLEMIEYESKTVGTRRKMQVYTPPGYSRDRKYPVLYLLHGIGGDETEWQRFATPNVILDNLIADGKAEAMIVVMPNGRAQKNDRAEGDVFQSAPAFAAFERELLDDVIPTIESRYSAAGERERRALAGLSMGGGQSLNFGLGHLETFAWIGAFSPAPNTKPPPELVVDPAAATRRLKLLWISCGNKDGLIRIAQGVHAFFKEKDVPHVWNVDGFAHDSSEWKNNFFLFSQRIFH
jgi:enterochelin esterase-like enzyme